MQDFSRQGTLVVLHRAVSAADGSSLVSRDHACSWLSQPPQSLLGSSPKPQTELNFGSSSEFFNYRDPRSQRTNRQTMPIRNCLPNGGRRQARDAHLTLSNLPLIPREILFTPLISREILFTPQRKMPSSLTERPGLESQLRSLPTKHRYAES